MATRGARRRVSSPQRAHRGPRVSSPLPSELIPWLMAKPDHADPALAFAELTRRPGWQRFGACRGTSIAKVWDHLSASAGARARAKAVCAGCPVRQKCLDFAMTVDPGDVELDGIWGGLDESERRRIRHSQTFVNPQR